MEYKNLDKHFIKPRTIGYGECRIPRKLKKKVKKELGTIWFDNSNGSRLWCYLGYQNKNYRTFLIKIIIENDNTKKIEAGL